MKKKFSIILILIAAISAFAYYYYYQQPHYIIKGTENALRKGMVATSSFNITESIFKAKNGEGHVSIKISYLNKYGKTSYAYMTLNFASEGIKNDMSSTLKKVQYEIFQKKKEQVKNGQLNIEPFSTMDLISASLDGINLAEIDFITLKNSIHLEKLKYKGPSLGGKVIELKDDGKHNFEFPMLQYVPGDIFPYKRIKEDL